MKHLLNNLSSEEKSRILEQHSGGKSIDTSKFKRLLESKLGDAKPLLNEEERDAQQDVNKFKENIGLLKKRFDDMMSQAVVAYKKSGLNNTDSKSIYVKEKYDRYFNDLLNYDYKEHMSILSSDFISNLYRFLSGQEMVLPGNDRLRIFNVPSGLNTILKSIDQEIKNDVVYDRYVNINSKLTYLLDRLNNLKPEM
jgi:hypothetical protein